MVRQVNSLVKDLNMSLKDHLYEVIYCGLTLKVKEIYIYFFTGQYFLFTVSFLIKKQIN